MEKRRARRLVVRRFVVSVVAAIIGGVGSFAIATPSRAEMPCALAFTTRSLSTDVWGNPTGPYLVNATLTNTDSVASTGWGVFITFPEGLINLLAWNLRSMPEYGDGWYSAMDYNKVIQPGQSIGFRFLVTMPAGVIGTPDRHFCTIY